MVQSLYVRTRRFSTGSHPIHGVMGPVANILPHLLREATLILTRVGATDVWLMLRPNAPSLSAGNSERSRNGLAPLGSGEDRCHSPADHVMFLWDALCPVAPAS